MNIAQYPITQYQYRSNTKIFRYKIWVLCLFVQIIYALIPHMVMMTMLQTDVIDHSFAVTWMNDFEEFHNSLDQETTYTSNLTRSLSLVLDQFYSDIKVALFHNSTSCS